MGKQSRTKKGSPAHDAAAEQTPAISGASTSAHKVEDDALKKLDLEEQQGKGSLAEKLATATDESAKEILMAEFDSSISVEGESSSGGGAEPAMGAARTMWLAAKLEATKRRFFYG
jgi:hypothetical protein